MQCTDFDKYNLGSYGRIRIVFYPWTLFQQDVYRIVIVN